MKSLDGIKPFEKKIWLSSPTMHGEELEFMKEAFESNWMSTVGKNINEVERQVAERIGCRYAVALSAGTAALHLATKLAGEKLYGQARPHEGTLKGKKVFCSDLTFDASVNPVAYEDGEAIFIDTEKDTWNMDPLALEKAFSLYPDVKLIVLAHLYGTPGKMDEILEIAKNIMLSLLRMQRNLLVQAIREKKPGLLVTIMPLALMAIKSLQALPVECS